MHQKVGVREGASLHVHQRRFDSVCSISSKIHDRVKRDHDCRRQGRLTRRTARKMCCRNDSASQIRSQPRSTTRQSNVLEVDGSTAINVSTRRARSPTCRCVEGAKRAAQGNGLTDHQQVGAVKDIVEIDIKVCLARDGKTNNANVRLVVVRISKRSRRGEDVTVHWSATAVPVCITRQQTKH